MDQVAENVKNIKNFVLHKVWCPRPLSASKFAVDLSCVCLFFPFMYSFGSRRKRR